MSDVAELRELAQRVRELASQARGCAGEMRSAQRVEFVGKAANRYNEDLRRAGNGADGAAAELDDAARALLEHARNVEERLAQIAAAERWFGDRLADARREISEAADDVGDAVTGTARSIVDSARNAPRPGSNEWVEFGRRWLR